MIKKRDFAFWFTPVLLVYIVGVLPLALSAEQLTAVQTILVGFAMPVWTALVSWVGYNVGKDKSNGK